MTTTMIHNDLFLRYSRQIYIEEISLEGQRKIMGAKVLIVGAGGLGSPIIQYLAGAGVHTLGVVDFDKVEIHNLNRQIIHTESNVGVPKVKSAERYVNKLNHLVHFIAIEKKMDEENAQELISSYDIIVDASDNFKTRYLINDVCVRMQKPLVYGSILKFSGQVAVFNYKGSKNLRAIFPEPPFEENLPDCDSLGVLGPLPGIVGSMMANLVLNIITDLPVQTNLLTLIDTLDWKFHQIEF